MPKTADLPIRDSGANVGIFLAPCQRLEKVIFDLEKKQRTRQETSVE